MSKEIVAVYNEKVNDHQPPFDIYNGMHIPHFDTPERAKAIITALSSLKDTDDVEIVEPKEFGMPFIYSVHDEEYIGYLKKISEKMEQKPSVLIPEIVDTDTQKVNIKQYPAFTYPSAFPHGRNPRSTSRQGDQGIFAFDTLTPIMANTYDLALNSAYIALTGADLLAQGKSLVYSLCRPPGHHAESKRMGGYCYLNNASLAARFLLEKTQKKVVILDIDAHHGNGTQDIFYDSSDVFYISLHGDPSQTPPFYSGYADEKGKGKGYGYNLNIPLPKGSEGDKYLERIDFAISKIKEFMPGYLIVSLGFDGYIHEPLHVFNLTTACYEQIANRIGKLNIPTLSVQEGGYFTKDLSLNIYTYLKSLSEGKIK